VQPQADVRLESVTKAYGDVVAVDGVDLEVPAGEFFTMLGPAERGTLVTTELAGGLR
jgi:ABC-type Fe3+/spermidine/putrescine transport system ATPase subunit